MPKASTSTMTRVPPFLFWPHSVGPYETELLSLFSALNNISSHSEALRIVVEHLDTLPDYPNSVVPHLRYRAYLLVMQDLLRQGWIHSCRQGRIYLSPPAWTKAVNTPAAIQAQKMAIRESLSYERLAQLAKSSVQQFIRDMERPHQFDGKFISIRSLFADGEELARSLEAISSLDSKEDQEKLIHNVVQPYLQLVTPNSRCKYTGLRLNDIWRYMRLTWSIPYNSTPGRNMFYLVRDAARPFHPIIGISALGNSMMQITVRDDIIGWTPKALVQRISSDKFTQSEAETIMRMLRETLDAALDDLATDDLVTPNELDHPTEATLSHLEDIADHARIARIELLQERRRLGRHVPVPPQQLPLPLTDMPPAIDHITQLEQQAHDALFRTKRARILRSLLLARRALSSFPSDKVSINDLRLLASTSNGKHAIQTLVRENKKRKVGINMMDIIVCGALPPYNVLLGGKLVAMLMASPQVVQDYKRKYEKYVSNIASKMKQKAVFRDPKLVFLGTTSLYHSGSSQYNRISIPIDQSGKSYKLYKKYGYTLGYGSVHFSEATIKIFNELQEHVKEATLINNRFGEGVNPKLRRVSAGLAEIGLENSERFMNHSSKRIVYGLPLGKAAYEFLRGETQDPEYFFSIDSPEVVELGTQQIINFWVKRWLLMRVMNQGVLEIVASTKIDDIILSDTIQDSLGSIAVNTTIPEELTI